MPQRRTRVCIHNDCCASTSIPKIPNHQDPLPLVCINKLPHYPLDHTAPPRDRPRLMNTQAGPGGRRQALGSRPNKACPDSGPACPCARPPARATHHMRPTGHHICPWIYYYRNLLLLLLAATRRQPATPPVAPLHHPLFYCYTNHSCPPPFLCPRCTTTS
jgi:hypothetical protein